MSLAPGAAPTRPHASRELAHFTTATLSSSIVHICGYGQIDAANALSMSRYVEAQLESTSRLIVDLHALEFFGSQGFSNLHRINVMCSRYAVDWVLLPGREVRRMLRICDPDGGLATAGSLSAAIHAVTRPTQSHLRLVTSR